MSTGLIYNPIPWYCTQTPRSSPVTWMGNSTRFLENPLTRPVTFCFLNSSNQKPFSSFSPGPSSLQLFCTTTKIICMAGLWSCRKKLLVHDSLRVFIFLFLNYFFISHLQVAEKLILISANEFVICKCSLNSLCKQISAHRVFANCSFHGM